MYIIVYSFAWFLYIIICNLKFYITIYNCTQLHMYIYIYIYIFLFKLQKLSRKGLGLQYYSKTHSFIHTIPRARYLFLICPFSTHIHLYNTHFKCCIFYIFDSYICQTINNGQMRVDAGVGA